MRERYWPPPTSLPSKTPETKMQLKKIATTLEEDGCIKNIALPDKKTVDLPPDTLEALQKEQYFTQIEINNSGPKNVYTHLGYYTPPEEIFSFCNVAYYENWNYDTGKKPDWHRYARGN